MSDAPTRISTLTRNQQKVLADLELFSGDGGPVAIPHRKLAESTGLNRRTVLSAIDRLFELQLIRIRRGSPRKASEYTLLYRGSVRLASGAISPLAMRTSTGGAR